MRIAVIAPAWFPVPPPHYGGTEWIVSLLTEGLVAEAHDVTLFASGDSKTAAVLDAEFPVAPAEWIGHTFWELRHAVRCLARADEFDVISDHSGLLAAALGMRGRTPFVHTVHGHPGDAAGDLYAQLAAMGGELMLVSVSEAQRALRPELPWVGTCHNAIDVAAYPFDPGRGDYLLFLGRFSPDKGAHRAIAVAEAAGLPLVLAGKCREPAEQTYFTERIEPHLRDGIEYVGEVSHQRKVELLQGANAVLFPIDWDEPFGLVLIEAMACGTPVIATRRGAVPEVVEHGVTGLVVDDWHAMVEALRRVDEIDPYVQRRVAEERFAPSRMVREYLDVFAVAQERWPRR